MFRENQQPYQAIHLSVGGTEAFIQLLYHNVAGLIDNCTVRCSFQI